MSANFLSVLLFIGQAVISITGWYLLARRQSNEELVKRFEASEKRLAYLEKYNKRFVGWVLGKFGVDLNGD